MAGGNHPKVSSHKPSSSSSSHRKSRWESGEHKPSGSGDSKHQMPPQLSRPPTSSSTIKDKPQTPKPGPTSTPSPSHPKPSSDPLAPIPGAPFPFPDGLGPPPPPAYGFRMLERRTIILADGSVRSYFALPQDYQDFAPPRPVPPLGPGLAGPGLGFDRRFPPGRPMSPEFRDRDDPYMRGRNQDYRNSLGLDGRGGPENLLKRRFIDDESVRKEEREWKDEFARQRQQLLQYGNVGSSSKGYLNEYGVGTSSPYRRDRDMLDKGGRGDELRGSKYLRTGESHEGLFSSERLKHNEVDQSALKKAFLHFVKLVNENATQKKQYLADGKQGPLKCAACGRSSKDFPDMHGLIMHTYNSDDTNLLVDHLGLNKALCILMGWNYSKPPENSKAYQLLSADEAGANQEDLILWPPLVIIHNTITGKLKDGRMEGLGNKAMDNILRDLGFGDGKSKSMYGREGHLGVTLIKFASDASGLREAARLSDYFEKNDHGRKGWARVQSSTSGKDDDNNPSLVKVDERTGEKKRIFYGYLGTASDLDKVDFDTRKKVGIESKKDYASK